MLFIVKDGQSVHSSLNLPVCRTEKVLAFTNEEAEDIAKTVRESGVIFTISYPHKTWPTLKAAKALVESGKLGKITYARVRDAHNGSTAGWLPPHFYDAAQTGGGAKIGRAHV